MKKCSRPPWILVLLADGFDEAYLTSLVQGLRSEGMPVRLVGLRDEPHRGRYGMQVMPDATLETINGAPVGVVVLPQGIDAVVRLHADPRVHRLLTKALESGSSVALSRDGTTAFEPTVVLTSGEDVAPSGSSPSRLLVQGQAEGGAAFARAIKQLFLAADQTLDAYERSNVLK